MTAQQSTALVLLPKEFQEDFLLAKFKEVESKVKPELLSVDTEEGRKHIKSLGLKINKSSQLLDKPMRDHLRELKALPKVLELNARNSKQRFENLRQGVLEPLEKAREWQDAMLLWLLKIPTSVSNPSIDSEWVKNVISEINKIDQSQIWPELKKKFDVAIEAATTTATVTLERLRAQEAQQAELEALRNQQAEAEQKEHDRVIEEAAEAKARQKALDDAKAEREAIERRAVEAKQREEQAVLDAEKAKLDAENAEKRRLQEIEDNKKRAEQEKIDAEARAKQQAEQAVVDELARVAEIAEQDKQKAIAREADKAHRTAINRAALVAMIAGGVDEDQAKKAITMIAKHQVPSITIAY